VLEIQYQGRTSFDKLAQELPGVRTLSTKKTSGWAYAEAPRGRSMASRQPHVLLRKRITETRFQTRLQDRPVNVEVEMSRAFGCAGCRKVRSLRDASGLLDLAAKLRACSRQMRQSKMGSGGSVRRFRGTSGQEGRYQDGGFRKDRDLSQGSPWVRH
jgi:hypothetical protein